MEKDRNPYTESAWSRVMHDTGAAFYSGWFVVVQIMVPLVFFVSAVLGTPDTLTDPEKTAIFWAASAAFGALAFLGLVVFVQLIAAPYRQRNDLRQKVKEFEDELQSPKLFDVVWPGRSLDVPLNRLSDGSFRRASVRIGPAPILVAHRGELTIVERLTAFPQVRITSSNGWHSTNAIRIVPETNVPHEMGLTWDSRNPRQWVLEGLPLTMAKDEVLELPRIAVSIADAQKAGTLLESEEKCTVVIRLTIRTDRGNPPLPDQVITLIRSDFGESLLASQ